MSVPTSEIGHTDAVQWWWRQDDDEPTPELRWPDNVAVYDQMRRQDGQVISVLRAVTLPIRRTGWHLDPNGARDEVVEHVARDLNVPIVGQDEPTVQGRTRGRFSWHDHMRLALLMLPFGHSYFEQVYRLDERGLARLRKLAWRPPRTISKIDVAKDGGLVAIEQDSAAGTVRSVRLPVNRLVAYVHDREGGNWLGQSLLRPAYKYWVLKDRMLRVGAQTVDRNGMGVPVYTGAEPPASMAGQTEEIKTWQAEDLHRGKKLATGFRSGNSSGASIPYGATLKLQGVDGDLPDALPWVKYYDEQMARAVLAHFLNLGTQTGSWALGSTFADFFKLSLQATALQVQDVVNQHVIEDLVDINWGESEPAPRIVFDEIGGRDIASAIKTLVDAGVLTPDEAVERYVRSTYGLPARENSESSEESQ